MLGRMDDEDGWQEVRLISTRTNSTPQISPWLIDGSKIRDEFRVPRGTIVKPTFSETLFLFGNTFGNTERERKRHTLTESIDRRGYKFVRPSSHPGFVIRIFQI